MDRHGEFALQLQGYGLSTAEVSYFMPDYPSLIQVFVWQFMTRPRNSPSSSDFSTCGGAIEAVVHSVRVVHDRLLGPRVWHPKAEIITLQ
jgi:uncharacterized protein Usg